MSQLIICEKPSQAKAVSEALNLNDYNRINGYYTDDTNNIYCTWCYGHLFKRVIDKQKWDIDNLPIIKEPTNNQIQYYQLDDNDGIEQQFKNIAKLIDQVDEVICSTDPDAEGETIYREVVEYLQVDKPQTRMWLKDLTQQGIRQAYNERQDISNYEGLRQRAYARSYFDWSFGLTFTQLTSLMNKEIYNVGRVQTPTLKLIVERYLDNIKFKSLTKYTVDTRITKNNIDTTMTLKKEFEDCFNSKEEVENYINSNPSLSFEIKENDKEIKPPKLHDLGSIQKWANKKLGISPKQTLEKLQSLYERKLITYPRTDCNKISENTANNINAFLGVTIKNVIGEVSAHEALTPTSQYQGDNIDDELDRKIYDEIYFSTLSNTLDNIQAKELEVIVTDNNLIWNKKFATRVDTNDNWTSLAYYQDEKIPNEISAHDFNDIKTISLDNLNLELREYQTKPKPLYTESSLISKMENIHNEFSDKELVSTSKEVQGIGTPATRADIIKNLFDRGYIEYKNKKNIIPTDKGLKLIEVLTYANNPLLDVEYSARLEQQLQDVEHKKDLSGFIKDINDTLIKEVNLKKPLIDKNEEEFSPCKCGSKIYQMNGKYGLYYKCKDCGIQFPDHNFNKTDVVKLLTGDLTSLKQEISKKTGKPYSVQFKLNEENKLEYVFPKRK